MSESLGLFERCFIRAEVQGFLEMLDPGKTGPEPTSVLDFIKRLATLQASI
ncbi:MAG: hypothetical protein MZV49_24030 [Rhodopseudomonas palustris]|nr:hypothetical protein [Rhodopseudomonas palustris]